MCGIAGFFTWDESIDNEKKDSVYSISQSLFEQTKSRGTDAAGFSYINKYNELVTIKGPVVSDVLVKDRKFTKLKEEMPRMLIMHCRAATTGSPVDNFNNHPIVADKRLSVIHNGVISNHTALKAKYALPAKGEVDSEVIPMMMIKNLNDLTKGKKQVTADLMTKSINMTSQEIYGGYACAAINTDTPDVLYLFRNGNPIVFAYAPTLKTVFFASVDSYLTNAFNIPKNIVIMSGTFPMRKNPMTIVNMEDDTIGYIKAEKNDVKLSFFALESNLGVRIPPVQHHRGNYESSTLEDLYGTSEHEVVEEEVVAGKSIKMPKKKKGLDFDVEKFMTESGVKEDWEIACEC